MFFIGQKLKHVHMTCFFINLYFGLLLIIYSRHRLKFDFLLPQKNSVPKYILRRKQMMKCKKRDIHFHQMMMNSIQFFSVFFYIWKYINSNSLCTRRSVDRIRFTKKCPCYYVLTIFSLFWRNI